MDIKLKAGSENLTITTRGGHVVTVPDADGTLQIQNITTAITSGSTDDQYPSAKAVYDALQSAGGTPDWQENDSASTSYVKNRTHYVENEYDVNWTPSTTSVTNPTTSSTHPAYVFFNGVEIWNEYAISTKLRVSVTGSSVYEFEFNDDAYAEFTAPESVVTGETIKSISLYNQDEDVELSIISRLVATGTLQDLTKTYYLALDLDNDDPITNATLTIGDVKQLDNVYIPDLHMLNGGEMLLTDKEREKLDNGPGKLEITATTAGTGETFLDLSINSSDIQRIVSGGNAYEIDILKIIAATGNTASSVVNSFWLRRTWYEKLPARKYKYTGSEGNKVYELELTQSGSSWVADKKVTYQQRFGNAIREYDGNVSYEVKVTDWGIENPNPGDVSLVEDFDFGEYNGNVTSTTIGLSHASHIKLTIANQVIPSTASGLYIYGGDSYPPNKLFYYIRRSSFGWAGVEITQYDGNGNIVYDGEILGGHAYTGTCYLPLYENFPFGIVYTEIDTGNQSINDYITYTPVMKGCAMEYTIEGWTMNQNVNETLKGFESKDNKVTEITQYSTNTEYPSAKAVYDSLQTAGQIPIETTMPASGFLPNVMYNIGPVTANTTFLMQNPTNNTIVNHYYWTFDILQNVPTITWPSQIQYWAAGSAPGISQRTHYEISVINGIATYMEVDLMQNS